MNSQKSEFYFWIELKNKSTNKVGKKFYKYIYVSCGCKWMEPASLFLIICSYRKFTSWKFLRFFPLVA